MDHSDDGNKTFDDELRSLVMHQKNDELKSILKTLTPSKLIDNEGMTLLHLAAKYNNLDMIEFSLSSGCDINAKNSSKTTPLFTAIIGDKFEAAKLLLSADADILTTDAEGKSTLQLLTEKETAPVDFIECFFEKLKAHCANVDELAGILVRCACPLAYVLLYVKDAQVMRALLRRKTWIDSNESSAALTHTVESVDLENLRVLVHYGPGAAKRKNDFFKDLYCRIGYSESARSIVRDLTGWEVDEALLQFLRSVFEKKSKDVVQMFLDCGIDVHVKNHCGQDLLAHLFGNPNHEVIELLKNRHFDVNTRGRGGISALHAAVINGLVGNVKFLLGKGADPNMKDDRGRTPLLYSNAWLSQPIAEHLLLERQMIESECVAELLLRYGADIQVVDDSERSVIEIFYYLASMQPILARLAVTEAQGTPIDRLIYDKIAEKDGYKDFYDNCLLQIEGLKKYKVTKSMTLFNALTEDFEKINVRRRDIIDRMVEYCDKCDFYRVYSAPLKMKLEKALEMYQAKCRAAVVIAESVDMLIDPHHLVTEKIVSFLSFEDLVMFV